MLEINWGSILTAVLIAVVPALAAAVVKMAWAWALAQKTKAQEWSPTLVDFIERAAAFAVQAAEQSGLAQQIEDKKVYALDMAERWLDAQGIEDVDLHLLGAAIEKAVLELFPHDDSKPMGFEK